MPRLTPKSGGGSGGPPTGDAGGVLAGTYPNPGFSNGMATDQELDAVAEAKADVAHGHAIGDVTNLQSTLNGKAASSHSHAQSDVTNLTADLAAKQATSEKAQANGYASLDGTGKVPAAQLPVGAGSAAYLELASDASAVVGTAFADAAAGLNIAVTANDPVRFMFYIAWVANAATTGARFSLNGPAATRLAYMVRWNTTATAITTSPLGTSYNQNFTAGTASDATNNVAIVEGVLFPSADGTLALRSAAEVVSPGSVTVKAGSSVLYW